MTIPPEELRAARAFAELVELEPRQLDGVKAANGLPDFELLDSGSIVGVLEVTRWADPKFRSTIGALKKKPILLSGATHDWHVQVMPGSDVKTLANELPKIVSDLERRSIETVSARQVDPAWLHVQALGVQRMYRGAPSPGARLLPIVVAPGGTTSREVLADIVESEVQNNLAKLQYGGGPQRHLWVWLEYDGPEGADTMVMSMVENLPGPPPRTPRIPVQATVWLAIDALPGVVSWNDREGWVAQRHSPDR